MPKIYEPDDLIDDQYRVERRLRGGMSYVYIAHDTVTQKQFALKSLNDEGSHAANQTDALNRFEREAVVWVNLDHHPHIVQAFAFLQRTDPPMLLLEYIDGPSLSDVFKSTRRLNVRQAIRWARQFCDGMHYVHNALLPGGQTGTLHRDIKPANILITRSGKLKITDFGLAKLQASRVESETGRFQGTLSFASPEQLHDAKHVDRSSDIFSFGIVFYIMLTGRHPFAAESANAAMEAIQFREPDWSVVPTPALAIVRRCLEKSPLSRLDDFSLIAAELESIETQLPEVSADSRCDACGFIDSDGGVCPVCGNQVAGEVTMTYEPASEVDSGPTRKQADDNAINGPGEVCSSCGARVDTKMSFCRSCGHDLSSVQCIQCGSWNPASNRYCNGCRTSITRN